MNDEQAKQLDAAIIEHLHVLDAMTQADQKLIALIRGMGDGNPMNPTVYHQRDYSNILLGKSTKYTIGSSGCLLCSVCSCENDAGLNMNPEQFNAWLIAHNGFIADKEGQIVNFVYSAADALGYLKLDTLAFYPNKPPVPAPIAMMDQYIKNGGYVVVEVDFNPQTVIIDQHWCRYLGSGMVMDPWYGDIADVAKRYKPGLTAKEAIIAAAYYKWVSA